MLVFGTRPEAIKMAPLVHHLRGRKDEFDVTVCVTAQHREMLDQVLSLFEIKPDVDLDLMKSGQDLFDVTSRVLMEMRAVLQHYSPDVVLVHGDTTTCLATAMAAFYAQVPVGHVEAGLRTFDLQAPFPEEFNRQVAGRIASFHFAPTKLSKANLEQERVDVSRIHVTGNTVIDSLHWMLDAIEAQPARAASLANSLGELTGFMLLEQRYVLITGHRRENFGTGFLQICEALRDLSAKYPEIHFVYPVHLNPNVQTPVNQLLGQLDNVHLIPPQDYEPFVFLLKHCFLVLTDSGGIQEEAPSLGKPVLVMRDVTERPEAVDAGTVRLVGSDRQAIVGAVSSLVDQPELYEQMSDAHNPYGDGQACKRIADALLSV